MNKCPDNCSGGSASRQHDLTDNQVSSLSEAAQKEITSSPGRVFRCNYCGCVYIDEYTSNRKLGDLDGGVTGEGWKSSKYP